MEAGAGSGKTRAQTGARRGLTSAAESARRALREAAERRGFAEPQILTRWPEIVGERLAGLCTPVKVSYPRGSGLGATLVVHAEGALATEVEHLAPRILERINQFYGYRAITRLRVAQTGAGLRAAAPGEARPGGFAEPAAAWNGPADGARGTQRAAAPTPGPRERAEAARLASRIADPELRLALSAVGAHILARRRARSGPRGA